MRKAEYFFLIVLVVVSLFLNLGLLPLYHEEPRRGVVALEMLFSGNYITPTIMGEPYYAKPPIFNWILILSYKLFGSFSEFAVRFPTVISLLLIGFFHFLFVQKFMDKKIAFYCSMFFITCGNIYFYFSLIGEIDIFYSFLTYLCIITIFYFYQSGRFLLLFLSAFFLGALGFLTKGFPSIIFLYVTLITFFASERKLKELFSIYHLLGIILFVLILGTYFYFYSLQNPLGAYLHFLWTESNGRTVLANPFNSLLKHLIKYPLNTLRALLPYSILLIFTFRWGFIKEILLVPVLRFSLLIFVSNYLVYLVSPGANQRYVYMLFPFILLVLCYSYFRYGETDKLRKNVINALILAFLIALAISSLVLPFLNISSMVSHVFFVSAFLFIISLAAIRVSLKRKGEMLSVLLFTVIVLRLSLDVIYLPIQASKLLSAEVKSNSKKIVEMASKGNLYLYGDETLFSDIFRYIFYIESGRGEILRKVQTLRRGDYFIAKEDFQESVKAEKLLSFRYKDRAYGFFKFI
jgi:4-amino-4-deoxy-L-arabinose transferase-like glycosyltransferase